MTSTTKMALGGLVAMLASVAMGCGAGAVHLRRGSWSGELALHGDLTSSEYAAQRAMLDHCGGRSRVLSPEEAERVALADGGAAHEVTRDASGRRVHYVCTSRAPIGFRSEPDAETTTSSASAGRAASRGGS